MGATSWLVVLVGCAAGCSGGGQQVPGDGAPADAAADAAAAAAIPDEHSGTRLKLQWQDIDGTRLRIGIVDSLPGEPCRPTLWADGITRCTPDDGVGEVYFKDAACTVPVGAFPRGCDQDPPRRFYQHETGPCRANRVTAAYRAGAKLADASYYGFDYTGACSSSPFGGLEVYALGAEIPASDMVALARTVPASAHPLDATVLESPDGLRTVAELHDHRVDADCLLFGDADDGNDVCFPAGVYVTNQFGDAACTTPVAFGSGSCPMPEHAVENTMPGCSHPRFRGYQVGGERPGPVYEDNGMTCAVADLGTDGHVYDLTTSFELAPVTYTLGDRVTPEDPMRVQYLGADGRLLAPASFYDVARSTRCDVRTATDGVQRCLPTYRQVLAGFRDSSCTQPLSVTRVYRGPAMCAPSPPPAFASDYVYDPVAPCGGSFQVKPVLGPFSGPVYAGTPERCSPLPQDLVELYELGAVIAPTEFEAATIVTDP